MTNFKGLSSKKAHELLRHYGENTIASRSKRSAVGMFMGQFRDALIMILLAATLISLAMGEVSQALTVSAIVVINALLGFAQEFKTEKTLEKLNGLAAPNAVVIRDGRRVTLPAVRVVPGDLAEISAGGRVPADGEILSCTAPCFDESMLTGESESVEKQVGDSVYMGTMLTRGNAMLRIKTTGSATQMGKIARLIGDIRSDATPLQKRLSQLSKYIGLGCVGICAVVAVTGILRGEDVSQMLMTAISLAVAAVPEGLPAIVTICLSLSVGKMVKKNALIRRLHAVETLGCATVICSDKTGTLTCNRMAVTKTHTRDTEKLKAVAYACNNAVVPMRGKATGESTEIALKIYAQDLKDKAFLRVWENPFDSVKKYMSVLCERNGGYELYTKGAVEMVLTRCTHLQTENGVVALDTQRRHQVMRTAQAFAGEALRVLALAWRKARDASDTTEQGLVFVGLVGLSDPPRKEAYSAVSKCRKAGIRPIMITGDSGVTACAIARELGISQDGEVISGAELERMDDARLMQEVERVNVFARVTPEHKLRIVKALRARGQVVAMTGDGVNDAPALKQADIGVAMGITGTDVSKQAADVVLLDDNFATMVGAVEQGRVIYANIRKFIRYLLSCNIGEVVTMFLAMVLGLPVPLLPIQILLVNLITDSLPAIALGLEGADADIMSRPPRHPDESVFSRGLARRIIVRGVLMGMSSLAAFWVVYRSTGSVECGRSASLIALVTTQLIHVFECKSEHEPLWRINLLSNPMLCLAVAVSAGTLVLCMHNAFLSQVFNTVPLGAENTLIVLGICMAVPILCLFRRK